MKPFRHFSIRNKLIVIILVANILTIGAGFGFMIVHNIGQFKQSMVEEYTANVRAISINSIAILAFGTPDELNRELKFHSAAQDKYEIIIFDTDMNPFGVFTDERTALMPGVFPADKKNPAVFKDDFLNLYYEILLKNNPYGFIHFRITTAKLVERVRTHVITMLSLLAVIIILSYFLARYLQRFVSAPILNLAKISRKISKRKDYTFRADKKGNDEIGILYDEFNNMLDQIEEHKAERDTATEQLLESEKKYRNIFYHAAYGIFQWGPDGRLLTANPAFARIFGYTSPQEAIRELGNFRRQIYVDDRQKKEFERLMKADGVVNDFEFKSRQKNGSIVYISESSHVVYNDKKQLHCYEGIVEDISQKKQAEELKIARDAAEAASKAKSKFLANMSHEIRTPMNAIMGFTELLDNHIDTEPYNQYIKSIRSSGKTLLAVINDILDLSKIEAGKLDIKNNPMGLEHLLNDIRHIFSKKAQEKYIDFRIAAPPSIPAEILLDETRIREILFNLLDNAVKFTDRGYVKLSLEVNHSNPAALVMDIAFNIEDTGIGIPIDQQEFIFDAFRQQENQDHARYGGTGLGLSITKHLTERLGGKISIRSREGKGSVFRVEFEDVPVKLRPYAIDRSKDTGPDINSVVFKNSMILVVEDVESNRTVLKGYLEIPGLTIIEAENGKIAMEHIKEYLPDLIIMDMRMPVMDGYETTRRIKSDKRSSHVPVIALTASVIGANKKVARESGCDGFLKKPIGKKELILELMKFLPYETVEQPPPPKSARSQTDISEPNIPIDTCIRLPQLLEQLESAFSNRWQTISNEFIIDEIEAFSKDIEKLGAQFQMNSLTEWGKRLYKDVQSFDRQRISLTLTEFPVLLTRIKSISSQIK